MTIALCLTAKNSSGAQRLIFDYENNETTLTLVGDFESKPIQIDFDSLADHEVEEFILFLQYRIDRNLKKKVPVGR